MPDSQQASVAMIRHVAERLGDLRKRVVFLGGAVTGLLLTDAAAPEARFTEDVDVVISIGSYAEYTRLEEALRDLGFQNARDVICRWRIAGVLVDIMPTDEAILGFSNRWYSEALDTATEHKFEDGLTVHLITAPYFVATKFEAFLDPRREGSGDYLTSRDMADIFAVIDGRQELVSEIEGADEGVRSFLIHQFERMLSDQVFWEALPGYLLPDDASQRRLPLLIERIKRVVKKAQETGENDDLNP